MDWVGVVVGICCIVLGLVFRRISTAGRQQSLKLSPSIGFRTAKSLASEANWRQMHLRMAPLMARLAWVLLLSGALTLGLSHLTPLIPTAAFLALVATAIIVQQKVTRVDATLPLR